MTDQNYGPVGDSTTQSVGKAQNSGRMDRNVLSVVKSPTTTSDDRQRGRALLDWAHSEGRINCDQLEWAFVFSIHSNAMLPQLPEGSLVIGIQLEPAEYDDATVVAVEMKSQKGTFEIGRVELVTHQQITLTRDNEQFGSLTIDLKQIHRVFSLVLATSPVY